METEEHWNNVKCEKGHSCKYDGHNSWYCPVCDEVD